MENHEIRLKNYPQGVPELSDFEVHEVLMPSPQDREVLVQNEYISVDPYMRGRMRDQESYVEPFRLNQPLEGGCVGHVVESRNSQFKEGDAVISNYGWRRYYVAPENELEKIDETLAPIQSYLGVMGMPGMTAYVGLLRIGNLADGENVFVSAASGAVGATACQIAKIKNCYVIGSAGSEEKIKWLKSVGIDDGINYKQTERLDEAVQEAFPEGINVYFDNVGGSHLDAALGNMAIGGRIVLCGMISQYNRKIPRGPHNMMQAIAKRLSLRGFIVMDHNDLKQQFQRDMASWIQQGKMQWRETVFEGLERAPEAFIGLFEGRNVGKMLVKVNRG